VRQFFSPRFWLTLVALGGLVLVLVTVFHNSAAPGIAPVAAQAPPERRIDLVSWIYQATPAPGFAVVDGVATTDLALQLDGTRTMVIKAGTPGEIDCPQFAVPAQCTVGVDLLGDAVLWFSVLPGAPGPTVQLPAVTQMLDGGWVQLANDWIVRRAPVVERSCPEDTSSLPDFIDTYGKAAASTFNFETQKIVKVTCPRADADTSVADTTVPVVVPDTGVTPSVVVGGDVETVDTVLP
jgi:hypothetical protein